MTVKQLIEELEYLDPDENIEYDYIATSGIIKIAKDEFLEVITKDEADTIICIMAENDRCSQLHETACNDIADFLDKKVAEKYPTI